jgi:acetolactate synthase-1/2/3 large subunit
MKVTVGEALVAVLAARGVEVVFGIPGVHTVELYRGLPNSGIRHVTARHEQGAAFMADGYARASGKVGVAFVITGPGLTNALTAMAQARADSVPILVISGVNQRASLGLGMGLLHELPNQSAMVAALCPSFQITSAEALEPVLAQAFAALLSGRPGPIHIEVPTDVMRLPSLDLNAIAEPLPPTANAAAMRDAVTKLNAAKNVVILAGGGAKNTGQPLAALAARLDAPVIQTTNARGLMAGHPLNVPASPSLAAVRDLIISADQILAIGTELGQTDYDMYAQNDFPDISGMIRIDLCLQQLARHAAGVRLHGDASGILELLLPHLDQKSAQGAARAVQTRDTAWAELPQGVKEQVAMLRAMQRALPQAMIVGDSTQPVYAGNLYYDHDIAGGWFNAATGYGALGFSLGAAVGAALGAPNRPVICLVGDGGLQFSPGELRTALDENLPIRFVVWNNSGFREIATAMADAGAEVLGCDPSPLDMKAFAAACGLPFTSVAKEPKALQAALEQSPSGPSFIEIRAL